MAAQLCRCLGEPGQVFLRTAEAVLNKPADQDVVVEFLNAIQAYFSPVCPHRDADADTQTLVDDATALLDAPPVCATTSAVQAVLEVLPGYRDDVRAMLVLSWVGESLVNPIFARTDAIGSVMRKKIEPVTLPIRQQLAQLLGS